MGSYDYLFNAQPRKMDSRLAMLLQDSNLSEPRRGLADRISNQSFRSLQNHGINYFSGTLRCRLAALPQRWKNLNCFVSSVISFKSLLCL